MENCTDRVQSAASQLRVSVPSANRFFFLTVTVREPWSWSHGISTRHKVLVSVARGRVADAGGTPATRGANCIEREPDLWLEAVGAGDKDLAAFDAVDPEGTVVSGFGVELPGEAGGQG